MKRRIQNVTKSEAQWAGPEDRIAIAKTAAVEQWKNDVGGQHFWGKDNRRSLRRAAHCCRCERFYLPKEEDAKGVRIQEVCSHLDARILEKQMAGSYEKQAI